MRRVPICVIALVLVPVLWCAERVNAEAGKSPQESATPKAGAVSGSSYAGPESCALCHADVVKKFGANPHSDLALMHGGKGVTCESCHGPGKAHVDSGGDATKIFRFTTASAKEVQTKCLSCHSGAHPNFARSPHGEAGVTCTSCHSSHSFDSKAGHMLKASQPKLCYTCHTEVKPAFAQPFHHKADEGLMQCSDCHDPHGTFQSTQLRATADQNAICTKCHSETAGPFVEEHPVVKTEGCTSCHSPHGSPNPRLLNVSNVNTLCLQCHSASINFNPAGAPSFHNQGAQYQACTVCHTQIHGSNANRYFFR